jgi:hypothetical protein
MLCAAKVLPVTEVFALLDQHHTSRVDVALLIGHLCMILQEASDAAQGGYGTHTDCSRSGRSRAGSGSPSMHKAP